MTVFMCIFVYSLDVYTDPASLESVIITGSDIIKYHTPKR